LAGYDTICLFICDKNMSCIAKHVRDVKIRLYDKIAADILEEEIKKSGILFNLFDIYVE